MINIHKGHSSSLPDVPNLVCRWALQPQWPCSSDHRSGQSMQNDPGYFNPPFGGSQQPWLNPIPSWWLQGPPSLFPFPFQGLGSVSESPSQVFICLLSLWTQKLSMEGKGPGRGGVSAGRKWRDHLSAAQKQRHEEHRCLVPGNFPTSPGAAMKAEDLWRYKNPCGQLAALELSLLPLVGFGVFSMLAEH